MNPFVIVGRVDQLLGSRIKEMAESVGTGSDSWSTILEMALLDAQMYTTDVFQFLVDEHHPVEDGDF